MNPLITYALIFLAVMAIIWLFFALHNYRSFKNGLERYEEAYIKHETMEQSITEVALKAKHFNEKEDLINDYPRLHQALLTKRENEKAFYKNAKWSFLKYGFLYNLV